MMKYEVSNPCFEVKTIHNHKSEIREGTSNKESYDVLSERYGCMIPFYGSTDQPITIDNIRDNPQ